MAIGGDQIPPSYAAMRQLMVALHLILTKIHMCPVAPFSAVFSNNVPMGETCANFKIDLVFMQCDLVFAPKLLSSMMQKMDDRSFSCIFL